MALLDIQQCKLCGLPFQAVGGGKVCGNCNAQLDLDLMKIRDYTYENEGPYELEQLSKDTEIPKSHIMQLIDTERIEIKGVASSHVCKLCGCPLKSGSMCEACRTSLATSLSSTLPKVKTPEAPPPKATNPKSQKMHTADLRSSDGKRRR